MMLIMVQTATLPKQSGGNNMQTKVCNTCGKPMKKLKHSILCDCGPRILTDRHAMKEKK